MVNESIIDDAAQERVPEEVRAQAKDLLVQRFKFISKPDATMKALARHGLEFVARDMAANPDKFEPLAPREAPKEIAPLDPLDILRKELQLPSLPQVFLELQQAINASNTSSDDLAEIISQDPSLTAFLLRMVNSAFYSLPMQIDTITRAVTVVGVNQLSTLAVGTSVMSLFQDIPKDVVDMERFWKHSVACGLVARKLCLLTGKGDPERSFVGGLLHDIGQLVLLKAVPERAAYALFKARQSKGLLYVTEKDVLGFNHATLGGMLLRKWNFPYVLVATVLEHHQPKKALKDFEPTLVHCAETITTGLGIGSSGEFFVQPPNPAAWASLELKPEQLDSLVAELYEELDEAFSILIS